MKTFFWLIFLSLLASCTTIHFRSNNSVPVTFEGNPEQQKEVSIVGHRNFYFWGLDPEEHVVYIDEDVKNAGYEGISKLIVYEHKNPQDMLISILTFGIYLPRGYTITGFTSDTKLPEEVSHQNLKK
ncbi:MAG: hypothetical protein AB7I27_09115 [Bacteriovoracaceae bacterium]